MEGEKIDISYETLWKAIIRPPRDKYDEDLLGEKIFTYHSKSYTRTDYTLLSKRGFLMKCSFIQLSLKERKNFVMPVVVYLHGNSSSRLEGLKMAPELLKKNINVFIFDFPGCGLSEGEYISLGYHEQHDLRIILDFLVRLPGVGPIGIWGRSMGAATAMLYACTDDRVRAACMDSPFMDFRSLAKDLCKKNISIPGFLIETAMHFVKKTVRTKNDLDIEKLRPIDCAEKTTTPGFFVHAMNDELIPLDHSIKVYEKYSGVKSINVVEGGHNSARQKHILDKIGKFFEKHLC